MSERRNFPAESKKEKKQADGVPRGSVDSFSYILDRFNLGIDENLRVIKPIPFTLAGIGVVLLLWRHNAILRLRGASNIPRRVFYENAKLPVKVVELNQESLGVVHMPLMYRVFGLVGRYQPEHVFHIQLSGVTFPASDDAASTSSNTLPSTETNAAPCDSPATPESTVSQDEAADQSPSTTVSTSSGDAVPDVKPDKYQHSPQCLSWMQANLMNHIVRVTLLEKSNPYMPAFVYQRRFPYPQRSFINLQVIKQGLGETAPFSSPYLIKSDIRKLTDLLLKAEQDAEKARVGIWENRQPSLRERVWSRLRWKS